MECCPAYEDSPDPQSQKAVKKPSSASVRLWGSVPSRVFRAGLEPDGAVAVVDERHGCDRVDRIGPVRRAEPHCVDEGLQLVGVGRRLAAVLSSFSGAGPDHYPVVLLLEEEVWDERLAAGPHHPQRHVPAVADHAAPGETGGAG